MLRRRELLAPAAMAASAAMGTGTGAAAGTAAPAPAPPGAPAPRAVPESAGPLVDPVAAAAVAAAAIRADEEAAARAAMPPAPVPPAPVAPPAHRATSRFEAPAVESGAGATPAPAPVEDSGGLGGLFRADAGSGPSSRPSSWPPAAPVPAAAPAAPPPHPRVVPRRRPSAARRRLGLLAVAAVATVAVLVALVVGLTDRDGGASAQEAPASSAPAAPTAAGPAPGTTTVLDGRTYLLREVQVTGSCVGNSYGDVATFFEADDCTGLARALWSTDVDGRPVVVSVSAVEMGDAAAARELRVLADTDGSGNVSDLLREGVGYPGSPAELSGAEYASAVEGSVVTIVETAWSDGGDGDRVDLDQVADGSLRLPMPAPAAD